jgi:[ribosomal protein S5]-alanine N-acetyltransferase
VKRVPDLLNYRFATQRLHLADFCADDVDLLHEVAGDAEVMRHFPKPLSYAETSEMMRKILDHYENHGHCFWKVMRKDHLDFIGMAGILHQEIEGAVEAEVAYRISKKNWNKGYATEAASGCIEYARETLGKTRLISLIRPENAPSVRVAAKLGAKQEKTIVFKGLIHDVYVY